MNCDDVFAVLTRGPFPTGSPDDVAVEAHLLVCTQCQQLAEALRPSDEMLRHSIGSDESQSLPGYWGDSLGSHYDLVISPIRRVGYPRRRHIGSYSPSAGRFVRSLNLWQFTAAVALGIVLVAALGTLAVVRHSPFAMNVNRPANNLSGNEPEFLPTADKNPLPLFDNLKPECLGEDSSAIAPASFKEDPLFLATPLVTSNQCTENCCTQCHHSGSEIRLSTTAKIHLEYYCRACHHD